MKPDVIILDEPTTGLDTEEAERIMGILQSLAGAGHAVVMVSHDMSIVKQHAQRIIRMDKGQVITDQTRVHGGAA